MSARAQAGRQRTQAMRQGRHADSARRRQHVIIALERASRHRAEIRVSAIARAALESTAASSTATTTCSPRSTPSKPPPPAEGQPSGPGVTHASLQADLAAAHERALRLTSRIRQLEHRPSEALGEQAWHESGLGIPADPGRLAQENSRGRPRR